MTTISRTFKLYFLFATVILLLAGCASTPTPPKYQEGSDKGVAIANIAQSMVGVSYRYGGSDPDEGFDCSGLVFYSHQHVGESVPRVSREQLTASSEVSIKDLKPGDLVFYRINGTPSHVGIYIGHGQFIHAPSSGKKVRVTSMSNLYFKPRFIRAGRLYQE